METYSVGLFESACMWTKSYGATIQMKPLWQSMARSGRGPRPGPLAKPGDFNEVKCTPRLYPYTPRVNYEDMYSITFNFCFESADRILCRSHSNETSSAVLLHGSICFSIFCKNEIWDFS